MAAKRKRKFTVAEASAIVDGFISLEELEDEMVHKRMKISKMKVAISNATIFNDTEMFRLSRVLFGDTSENFVTFYKTQWQMQILPTDPLEGLPTEYSLELSSNDLECNAILFIFQTSFCQKLKLKLSSDLSNVLTAIKVQILTE